MIAKVNNPILELIEDTLNDHNHPFTAYLDRLIDDRARTMANAEIRMIMTKLDLQVYLDSM